MDNLNDKEIIKEAMIESQENSGLAQDEKLKSEQFKNPSTETELEKLKEKLSQAENQYLRLLADFQNLQKRSSQERDELYKYAAQKTIEVLLPALDTFDYAKSAVKSDSPQEKIIEDFTLVFEMLLKCLKDIGLKTIEETGVPFDPFQHEPLHQIPTEELPDQTVIQVLKKGYILNDKVIRPALVSVSVKR